MKIYQKRVLAALLIIVLSMSLQACNNGIGATITKTEATEFRFDSSKTLTENIDILNRELESKLGKQFTLSSTADYEKNGQSDWTLLLEDDKAGFDISTWKYNYDPNSDDGKYMDAVLLTFIYFYGKDMGNSLWQLTGDLNDGGADEISYGFIHEGGQAIYKNGNTATYELSNNDNFYIWLTP